MFALLHRICREDGISAVVSLHQVDLAKRYADRIVGLAQCKVVFDAAPDQLNEVQVAQLYEQRPPIAGSESPRPSRIPVFPLNLATVEE
ncbi:MAG: phnC [Burkholderia sp.]|nr:phnC [Burkholderia sp.]